MYYGMNPYGLSPYMYDDPYTTLQRAQLGLQVGDPVPFEGVPTSQPVYGNYGEPQPSNFRSYREFKDAYDKWVIENSMMGQAGNFEVPQNVVSQDQVVGTTAPTGVTPSAMYQGPSVVEYLGSTGKSSDYATRKQIAKVLGIPNYKGTPGQNKLMISLLAQNPGVLNSISQRTGVPSRGIAPSPTMREEEEEVVDTPSINIPMVDTSGNVIDTLSGRVITQVNKTGLPKPTTKNKKTGEEDEGLDDVEKALVALTTAGILGGAGFAGFNEIKDVIANQYKLTGTNLKNYNEIAKKKLMPKIRGAAKAADNLGQEGRATYDLLEELYQDGIREARKYKDMAPDERITYDLLEEQRKISNASPKVKRMMRTVQNQAPKGTPKLTVPNTPKSLPKPKVSVPSRSLPKPTFSYRGMTQQVGDAMGRASNMIKSSTPYKKAASYLDELGTTARNLKNAQAFKTAGNLLRRFRFQEGGEQQNQMMQQIIGLISQELQQNKSPYEIAQMLMTYGISQKDALDLVDQVTMEMSQYMQPNMAGAPQGDDQGYMAADAGEETEQDMMMAYGGGYSGTYDQGSGSYFQMGGGFIPTYGDILPQYMYGSVYDNPNMYYNQSYMQDGGSLNIGDTLDVSPEELEYLRQQGYDFDIV